MPTYVQLSWCSHEAIGWMSEELWFDSQHRPETYLSSNASILILGLTQPPMGTRGIPVTWFQISGATCPLSPPAFMALTGTTLPMYEMMSEMRYLHIISGNHFEHL